MNDYSKNAEKICLEFFDTISALYGNKYSVEHLKNGIGIHLNKYFEIKAFCDGPLCEWYVEINCGKYGKTHFHIPSDCAFEEIHPLLDGNEIIVSKIGLFERKLTIVEKGSKVFGIGKVIIDKNGIQ
ncbi:MAG: hypothetical protein IJ306_08100 [Oscillospiraceae bacterium]|nr:hypothetical protein [Oscillospiraceae bacterium]